VDSKIRGHCWWDPSPAVLSRQFGILKEALLWNPSLVSRRVITVDNEIISGHAGEWLGCLIGAAGALYRVGLEVEAEEAVALIEEELQREARAFAILARSTPSPASDAVLLKVRKHCSPD
jgi:hypothetical protein